ncbi:uncharacterized protein ACIQIH_009203 [Cyanocitta cristata]
MGQMSSRGDTPEPGTSAANTRQAAPAAPQDNNREDPVCPECRDISTVCSSSCQHCFCQLCLWDWCLGEAVCPRCQRPTRHPYPQHVALYHEVQDRVYSSKRRWQPWSCSGHFRCGRPWERRQRRSTQRPHDGHWQSRHNQGSDSPRRRWWQQRRAWEDTRGEGRAPRFEWDIPASSRGSQSRCRSRRSWSQQERSRGHRRWGRGRERSHGRERRWGTSSRRDQDTRTGSHDHSARQRRRRSWNADDGHTPMPQHNVPSGRSERHQWEDSDSSGHQHRTRSRTRGRSHRRGQDSQTSSEGTVPRDRSRRQRCWRRWNAERG